MGLPDYQRENERRGQGFLVDVVLKMKQNMEDLQEDNNELDRMVEQLKLGQNSAAFQGKLLSDDENSRLQTILRETEQRFHEVEQENRQLKSELETKDGYQSAFQSNNKNYQEKLSVLEKSLREKDEKLRQLKNDLQRQTDENIHLREESNMIQGRCLNLQRDIELSSSAMNKLSDNSGSMGTQMGMLKNRVSGLEEELSRVREEKTD